MYDCLFSFLFFIIDCLFSFLFFIIDCLYAIATFLPTSSNQFLNLLIQITLIGSLLSFSTILWSVLLWNDWN